MPTLNVVNNTLIKGYELLYYCAGVSGTSGASVQG